jgi:hypothetical protein
MVKSVQGDRQIPPLESYSMEGGYKEDAQGGVLNTLDPPAGASRRSPIARRAEQPCRAQGRRQQLHPDPLWKTWPGPRRVLIT